MTDAAYLNATRASYDTVAASYHELLQGEMADMPYDRAMLAAFAELVSGPVVDLGCGPGRITAHLASLGVKVSGVDLSPAMVEVAREKHPDIDFAVGSMNALDLADESVDGLVAWYSIIHTPPELLPEIFGEFHRILTPGGHALLAFKAGDETRHLSTAYGHDNLDIDVYWLEPDHVATLATNAGLTEVARLVRTPGPREGGPQAYFLARKPAADSDQP